VSEEIGRGLLGPTFKGVDTRNGRPVAVKFLRAELLRDRAVAQRLLAEVKLARGLEHPSLVRLLGLAEIDRQKAAVMEFVEGYDLAALIRQNKRLSVKQGLDLLTTLCIALGFAHQNNLLHLDLKMTNVMIAKGGKVRLTGIGLGALRTAGLGGDDGYPPPEFLRGHKPDERCDIYALGGLLFHGLSGVHPSRRQPSPDGASPSLLQLAPDVPETLERIISTCLSENPIARFNNVVDLLDSVSTLRS